MTSAVSIEHSVRPSTDNADRASRSNKRNVRILLWVGFITLVLALPMSAYAWTRYQYYSGTSSYGDYYAAQTSGYQPREYDEVFHSTQDEWQVTYYFSDDSTLFAQAAAYSDPIELGPSGSTAVYADCEVIDPESSGQPFDCATTVP